MTSHNVGHNAFGAYLLHVEGRSSLAYIPRVLLSLSERSARSLEAYSARIYSSLVLRWIKSLIAYVDKRNQDLKQENRRKKTRRQSNRIIQKAVEVFGTLERIAKGEEVDFTEAYADLVGMKDKLGRRKEDRKLGESLCATIEALAGNPGSSLSTKAQPGDTRLRKIRLTKIGGESGAHKTIVGWEEKPPIVGRRYQVFSKDGAVIRTSAVTKVAAGYVKTRRSV